MLFSPSLFIWYHREPRTQRVLDLNNEKFNIVFSHPLIIIFGCFRFSANSSAACEKKRLRSLLIPLKQVKTNDAKVPFFTWRIGWLYCRFFSFPLQLCAET